MPDESINNLTSTTRRDEAERLLRSLIHRDAPWASEWQIEEVVRDWFEGDADKGSMDRLVATLRHDLEPTPPPDFGGWLREQLNQRGWSQSDLARKIESHPSLVSKWIRGLQRPEPLQCRRLSSALRVDYGDILTAAGHYWPLNYEDVIGSTITESPIRQEFFGLVIDIPEPLLVPLIPMLRALAEPDVAASTLAEVSQALRRMQPPQQPNQSEKEGEP
jgi:transcriptional regulator with XRE-family HTH domain